ncbi:META domain-containing protein [Rhodobaculum claviforme]|uniref:META domain-containing protein n=1 Tax=Rhodobaculum claviforme TaxID=1549854 RepID=A0A934TK62_9RHOB|nr:META domain-containing protein [Rhodobaculum claviforme]MBK5926553.1 hypothetical protein [Rhodobaculum claviforme]
MRQIRLHAPLATPVILAVLLASPALAREISGTLGYPERIALPPGAEVALEVRDPSGAVVAETLFATEGRQVPLDFALSVPDGIDLTLRAAVFEGGRPLRKTDPVPVAGGDADLVLGELRLLPHMAMGFATHLRCGPEAVTLGFVGDIARLRTADGVIDLRPVPAASGARFEAEGDPGTWVWSRGSAAMVSIGGEELPECLPAVSVPDRPFRAYGHEPAWAVTLDADTLRLTLDFGARVLDWPAPEARAIPQGGALFATDGLEMAVQRGICRDIATGMPHPFNVTVTHDETTLSGCGGAPGDLLSAQTWQLTDIAGTPLPEGVRVLRMAFDGDRMALSAPCNQAFGPYALTGEGLGFGPIGATQMMCDPAAMEAEAALFTALAGVDRFDITDAGALHLIAADAVVVRAAPLSDE